MPEGAPPYSRWGTTIRAFTLFGVLTSGNMKEFERDFRVPKIIKLEQNYRSHGNILDAANALIRNNNGRLGKNLWTSEGKWRAYPRL